LLLASYFLLLASASRKKKAATQITRAAALRMNIGQLHADLDGRLQQSFAAVVVKNASRNFLELLVGDLWIRGHDFFAHSSGARIWLIWLVD
jgi:hypothetical protein